MWKRSSLFTVALAASLWAGCLYAGSTEDCALAFERKAFEDAIKSCRTASANGDAGAKYILGMMYLNGWGLAKDAELGAKLVEYAADEGVSAAIAQMGELRWNGVLAEKSPKLACDWWERAASMGDAKGQEKAGVCYMTGRGRPKNLVKAYQLLKEAADKGSASAAYIVSRYREVFPSDEQVLTDR